jgi:enediyne biosynthesis protein E5
MTVPDAILRLRPHDPRLYQIATLASLLVYGLIWLDFEITPARAALMLATVLVTQAVCDHLSADRSRPEHPPTQVNVRSALISGLSLCLLLRTNRPELAVLAAVVTIAAKFLVRFRGKHVFNPTNGGLVAMLLLTGQVWVSPGQWGSAAFFAFLMACLGSVVVKRASRSDVTYAFILFYGALLFGRSLYLGEPVAIPLHRLESGGLLLFTFFMISDPKTTPDSRAGRVVFAALVAFGAWYVQFRMFRTNGLLWSLAACSLSVPLIDWLLPGDRYTWLSHPNAAAALGPPVSQPATAVVNPFKGAVYETAVLRRSGGVSRRLVGAGGAWLLRLLRRQGRHENLQQGIAGRPGS